MLRSILFCLLTSGGISGLLQSVYANPPTQPSSESTALKTASPVLRGPLLKEETTKSSLIFTGDQTLTYSVFKLDHPTRLMVDVRGVSIQELDVPQSFKRGPIQHVSAIQLKHDQVDIARLILTLKGDPTHFIKARNNQLFIEVMHQNQKGVLPQLSHSSRSPKKEHSSALDLLNQTSKFTSHQTPTKHTPTKSTLHAPKSQDQAFAEKKKSASPLNASYTLTHIQLRTPSPQNALDIPFEKDDVLRLEMTLSGLPQIRLAHQDETGLRLILEQTVLASHLEKRLDLSSFNTPLTEISFYQGEVDQVYLEARFTRALSTSFHVHKNQIYWTFNRALPSSQASSPKQLDLNPYEGLGQASVPQRYNQENVMTPKKPKRRKKRYFGKRIKINIQEGNIHSVLRFLAECGRVNIVTSDDVKGTVNLMLNQVPWDQALDIILRTKGLDMVREGNIIRVASREAIAAERKAELEKNQIKEQLKPIMIRLITVNHAEGKEMINQVKGVLSPRGKVSFDSRTNTLIIKDIDEHIEAAEDLVRRLDTQTPQVLIEARIVEVNKVNEKELGIQWGGSLNRSVATGNPTGLAFPSAVGIKGAADDAQFQSPGVPQPSNFMVNLPATVGAGSGGAIGFSLGSVDSAFNLNVRLSAAANRGMVKIISSPKITTLDNKKALISQGVSIPISQISAQGVQTTFFDATLSLEVTPHVTQDGNIYLQLKANNDTPDFQNVGSRGDPTILKKEASTQVLLQDGETTVIGGIYTSNAGRGQSEWPYLSQIPIIGALFRSTSERSQRNELLIFITPKVINRLASQVNTQ